MGEHFGDELSCLIKKIKHKMGTKKEKKEPSMQK